MYVLRNYQQQVVDGLKHLQSSALYLGTGTGKTITSLELTTYHSTDNLIVICPHNAIQQWKNTINERFPDVNVIDLKKSWSSNKINEHLKTYEFSKKNAFVINYDMVYRIPVLLNIVNSNWSIILDEMHRIKNYGTRKNPVKITGYVLELSKKTPWKIGLTATPTQGNFGGYIDYYTQIKFLGYTDFDYYKFYDRYVVYEEKRVGNVPFPIKTIVGYKNINEVEDILVEVSKRYVPKIGDFEPQFNKIILPRSKNYARTIREKVYKDIMLTSSAKTRIAKKTLTSGTIMGYNMNSEYFEYVDNTAKIDWLEDFLKDTDETVIILYTYNVELRALEKLVKKLNKKYIKINGDTKDKYKEVNEKEYEVVLGQFMAISEALDGLQKKCHIEIFYSMPESSILYIQALGRIDRIGQTKVPMYYFLLMEKTIDMGIMELIESKVEFSESVLDLLTL